jgi:hypothetical protein
MNYKKLNIIVGWFAFAIAAITYLLTVEPTASYWDCGEFITTAYKLEIGHPPGATFFMLLGNFFTTFVQPHNVGLAMNIMSAMASAFTILFLFWTITHLAKRLINNTNELSTGQTLIILGSGLVGALAYTFSDTFWFSAVEAEVYAMSSLFTAIVFWAILKWENIADQPHANKWLILICYLAGLSIGVHLLNLLAIPAIVFVFYYKKFTISNKGIFYALLVSGILVLTVLYGIIPGTFSVATLFERIFTNGFNLPVNTGFFVFLALIIAGISVGIYYTHKYKKIVLNTILVGVTVILIGYSSVGIIIIRSNANPPMDQNSPDNFFALLTYLNREQYGSSPLLYGQYYNSPLDANEPYVHSKNEWRIQDGKYVVTYEKQVPNYNKDFCTFFPRMWSRVDQRHIDAYKSWGRIKGIKKQYTDYNRQTKTITKPTFVENMRFFFRYQVNFMYMRYFMWNFVGRQNDIQGHGNLLDGNWISGIKFIDEARLGNQDNLPPKYANNPGRNTYFFLPLLLGLIGIYFQSKTKQGKRDLWVVTLLFLLTGVAIVIYLNQYPIQPRERDYAFAGSFYAFTIWIGLGVAGIYSLLKKIASENVSAIAAIGLSLVAVPGLMAAQNWDDHNRAQRRSAADFGHNYLASVDSNGIIFTNGDNDTFPLWYNQEVAGVGTDKRVCNLSYLQTDWYVKQMQQQAYESEPLPISFKYEQYMLGTRDVVYVMDDPRVKRESIEIGEALRFIKSDNPQTKIARMNNASFLPVRKLFMTVDKEAVIKNGVVAPEDYDQIVDTMYIEISDNHITKDQLMILDMLYNNNWERPIYYAVSVGPDKYMSLDKYFRLEGLSYRIVPILSETNISGGNVNTELMYNRVINDFKWGNIELPNVYLDENNRRMLSNTRNNFQKLADALSAQGKRDSAVQILDLCMEKISLEKVPHDYFSFLLTRAYITANSYEKADKYIEDHADAYIAELEYFFGFSDKYIATLNNDIQSDLYFLRELSNMAKQTGNQELVDKIESEFELFYAQYISLQQ